MQNISKRITKAKQRLDGIHRHITTLQKETSLLLKHTFERVRLTEQKLEALKDLCLAVFALILSGILSSAEFPLGIYPLGFAAIAVSGRYTFFAFAGAAVASIFYNVYCLIYFITYLCLYIFRMVITKGSLNQKRTARVIQTGMFCFACGIASYIAGGFLNFELFATIALCACSCFSAYMLSFFYDKVFEHKKVDGTYLEAAVCCVCIFVCYAIKELQVGQVQISLVLSAFFSLYAACMQSPLYGGAVGLVCAIACSSSPKAAIMLGFASGAFGIVCKKGKFAATTAYVVTTLCLSAYVGSIETLNKYFPELIIGMVLFLPVYPLLPKQKKQSAQRVAMYSADKDLNSLSGTFSSLSDVFFKMSDKMKYPALDKVEKITLEAFENTCQSCSMQDLCICRQSFSPSLSKEIFEVLKETKLKREHFPKLYVDNCIKTEKIVEYINDKYSQYLSEYFKTNKTEILASQYSAMARIMRCTAQKSKSALLRDEKTEKAASLCLDKIGVSHSGVHVCGERNKVIEVFGVNIEKIPCSAKELSEYMSKNCGIYLTEPEFVNNDDGFVMRFYCRKKINIEYAKASRAKGQSDINGDTTTFFENDEGFFYALISDGMGSGRDAALTSRLTSVFIEKLLTTGTHKSVTLELLNNLLLAKNDECFATVDLLEVDMLKGKASFIKAGAAPAYIIRSTKLYKIASNTPPAGIIERFTAEKTKFSLCGGDIILMLSDGIVESFDDSPWIYEMLKFDSDGDIGLLCESIIDKATSLCVRDDDMSVVAARVLEN